MIWQINMVKILKLIWKKDFFIIPILLILSPLFFYKLGQSSLVSWDEAWYASIARNILLSGDIFNLTFNGKPYLDHPPAGFWFMAIFFKLFGINEFTARFPSAILGFLSIIMIYLLGKKLFNKVVGVSSAVALPSAFWFLYRARSGNLDIVLTFMFLLTIFLALKVNDNKKYLIPFSISLTCVFLAKTGAPLTIIPVLLIIFWKKWKYSFKDILIPLGIFLTPLSYWFLSQLITDSNFLNRYLQIGLPGVTTDTSYLNNFKQIKEYLHFGIGKWFWPSIVSIFLGLFLFQKRFLILSVFFITFFLPFIFSSKGHIWHLVPLHPIMILSFFGFFYTVLEKLTKLKILTSAAILIVALYFSSVQIRQAWYQFIDIPSFVSDDAILSREAGKYPYTFYIDSSFEPSAVFYSGKEAHWINEFGLPLIFKNEDNFLLIIKLPELKKLGINPKNYKVLKEDRDKALILFSLNFLTL